MRKTGSLSAFVLAVAGLAPTAPAWPLEHLLNAPRIDARSPARDESRFCETGAGQAVGQTFRTGTDVVEIVQIAVWQAFWHATWQPDESLVLTLWDSPQKRTSYGRCSVPYARRMSEQAIDLFRLDACVEPNRSYYLELTVETAPLKPAEVPAEWLLSATRPASAGGDGVVGGIGVARGDYAEGTAFVGGREQTFDLWFEVHARPRADREALFAEAFGRFDLEYAPLTAVRKAVEARDWDAAVCELIRHFEGRTDLVDPQRRRPRFDPSFDTAEADLAAEGKVLQKNGPPEDLGPFWNHFTWWPERGGVGLTRGGLRKPLAEGYERTGNAKYARAMNDMLGHFFSTCPSPIRAGMFPTSGEIPAALPAGLAGGSMWSALSIGARMTHGFHYYATFADSPLFERSVRAMWIINMGEMAEVLGRMKGGGNWETQISDALFEFGLRYPEFKGSHERVRRGLARIVENASETVHPDGALREPTINYHLLVLNRYSKVIERCRSLKIEIPESLIRTTEKMFEYVMYATLPDGTLPTWGDSNPPSRTDLMTRAAELFSREDFRYVATGGRQGTPPEKTSHGFPDGGFYYMRTGWGADAHFLGIRCGRYGSHGHRDPLSVVASAFGQTVLIDPGIHTYGSPQAVELNATRSHSTVTVDDRNASHARAETWVPSEHFAFFSGQNEGYDGLADIRHRRRVWFLKPMRDREAIWAVFDEVAGAGEHEAAVRWRFAPMAVREDRIAGRAWTAGDGGNLLIQTRVAPGDRQILDKAIGVWGELTELPVLRCSRRGALPTRFATMLVPFRGSAPPPWEWRTVDAPEHNSRDAAMWAERGNEAIVFVEGHGTTKARRLTLPDGALLEMIGDALAVRFAHADDRWQPTAVHGVGVRRAFIGERRLIDSAEPVPCVDAVLK